MKPFRFKQFSVSQGRAAMKVGTDGVLLGAWCDVARAMTVLDIGTGTGVIALMIAQRNLDAAIDAIEPETGAWEDAQENFAASPWSDRLLLKPISLADLRPMLAYDVVVCNPPFFINSLTNPDPLRANARHTLALSPEEFCDASRFLSPSGLIAGIYPPEAFAVFREAAAAIGLHPKRICEVRPTPDKAVHRILFEFGKAEGDTERTELVIEEFGRHQYAKEYIELTSGFYLKM